MNSSNTMESSDDNRGLSITPRALSKEQRIRRNMVSIEDDDQRLLAEIGYTQVRDNL